MCGLHKQNVNGLLTIGLHIDKANNQGHFLAFIFVCQISGRYLVIWNDVLTGYMGLKSNLYVVRKNFWPWVTLWSFLMALYHCLTPAVRGMQKWVDCIVTNWLINWLELISDYFNESEIARRSILTFKMLRMDQYYSSYELFPVLNQMPLVE